MLSEDGEKLYRQLNDPAGAEGLKFTYYNLQGEGAEADPNYNGYYKARLKLVDVMRANKSHMVKPLAHELTHHFDKDRELSSRDERETVSKVIDFVVNSFFKLDTTSYTFYYVAGWAA